MSLNPVLNIERVTAMLGRRVALHNVSVSAEPGKIVAVFGHNGAGKSTLLRCVMGALPILSGEIHLDFTKWHRAPHALARAGVAYLPQSNKLFPSMTVQENLLAYSEATGQKRSDFNLQCRKLSSHFQILKDAAQTKAKNLSGGQIQQVAIARTFLTDARLLLLDEPTMGLTPQARRTVFDLIRAFVQKNGRSVVVVEHRIQEALALVDYAYILRQGEVIMSGESRVLVEAPERLRAAVM